jgi:hypothetical protein
MAANASRSTSKRSTGSGSTSKRSTGLGKASTGKSSAAKRAQGGKTAATKSRTHATRSVSGRTSGATSNGSKRSSSRRTTAGQSSRPTRSNNGSGAVDTVKHSAGKALAPAVGVGAAAIGIVGGIALKNRTRRKTVLGVPLPRSIGKSLPDIDAKSIAKSVGQASKQFAKTTKNVSKDLERAGDQAERIGKILD